MARQRRAELGLGEAELIVTRRALDELRDRLYVLEAAVEYVRLDLAADPGLEEYRDAVRWLLDAAAPLVGATADFT